MNLAGLDASKWKSLVIEKWHPSPELWPVKVPDYDSVEPGALYLCFRRICDTF